MFPRPVFVREEFHCKTVRIIRVRALSSRGVAALYCDTTLQPQKSSKQVLERLTRQVAYQRGEGSPRTASETKAAWVPSSPRGIQRDRVLGGPSSRAIDGQIHKAGRKLQAGSSKPLWWDPVCAVFKTCGLPFYKFFGIL